MNLQWKQWIRICWIKKIPAAVKRAWSKAVYINQAVTRQTRLQLVPSPPDQGQAPPDPNRAPPDPNRAPPDPNRAPPGPDPAPKPSRIGLGRLALTRCCRSGCRSGAAAAGDCIPGTSSSLMVHRSKFRKKHLKKVRDSGPSNILKMPWPMSWLRCDRKKIPQELVWKAMLTRQGPAPPSEQALMIHLQLFYLLSS